MPGHRPAPRRRQRPVRLLRLLDRTDLPITGETAQAYEVVLRGGALLRQHDPAWFAEHVAHRPVTLEQGLGVTCAFWQLVERDVCPLRWPDDGNMGFYGLTLRDELAATPEETLVIFDGVSEEWLNSAIHYYLMQPRPRYYGLGVQSVLDEDLDGYQDSHLVILLWHLFSTTGLSLGLRHLQHYTAHEDISAITALRPLPPETPMDALHARLATAQIPGFTSSINADLLIRYAFGATGNTLADYTDYECEQIMDVDIWEWNQLADLRDEARDARAIADAFHRWDTSVQAAPDLERALRRIAAWLHREARAARRDGAQRAGSRPARLVEILGDMADGDDPHPAQLPQLLAHQEAAS